MIGIRNPEKWELPLILGPVNQEFVFGRKRKTGLAERYPSLFSERNLHNLFVMEQDSAPVAFLAAREAKLKYDLNIEQIYFIGDVFTREEYRGLGLGLKLMEQVTQIYKKRNFSAGVLWTSIPGFYSKTGWSSYHSGFFVKCSGIRLKNTSKWLHAGLENMDKSLLMELWNLYHCPENRIVREIETYNPWQTKPLPSDLCKVIIIPGKGYLVYGIFNNSVYLYELVSSGEEVTKELFSSWLNTGMKGNVFLNLDPGTAIDKKFLEKYFHHVEYDRQNTGMYVTSRPEFKEILINTTIPYLDRI